MPLHAEGRLHHHFWLDYYATIILVFDTEEIAQKALPKLIAGWQVHPKFRNAIVWHGRDDKLKDVEKQLVTYGADPDKISSISKGIDSGERFSINIP
jgi:hypothetical protein